MFFNTRVAEPTIDVLSMPKAEFWLGSACAGGGTADTPGAETAVGWPLGTMAPAGGPETAGPAGLPPLKLAGLPGVMGVAGVGGSASAAEASPAGVAAALRFDADFFCAAVCGFYKLARVNES